LLQDSVFIVSGSKPVDDHRLYEKWGLFFHRQGFKNIHIIGKEGILPNYFVSHCYSSSKKSLSRLMFVFRTTMLFFNQKPKIIVICSFELLISGFIYHIFKRKHGKIYYDIWENYTLNISTQGVYVGLKKYILLAFIWFCELLGRLFITHFFYTDNVYLKQLSFLTSTNSTWIKNLYSYPSPIIANKKKKLFLITGTLSEAYGFERGVKWIASILKQDPDATFKIIGHNCDATIEKHLPLLKALKVDVSLNRKPITHNILLQEIARAETLLLPYSWTSSFKGCMPVKLLEALYLETKVWCLYDEDLAQLISHPKLSFFNSNFESIAVDQPKSQSNNWFSTFYEAYDKELKRIFFI
jgi:hypothetical protein